MFFIWRMSLNRLPTLDNLKHKNIIDQGDALCCFFHMEEESLIHVMFIVPLSECVECNDPPHCYDITTLNREKFQILNENSVNLLIKNKKSKFSFFP